ncbi:hypothetical protein Chor_005104 [Crotalus horridus]
MRTRDALGVLFLILQGMVEARGALTDSVAINILNLSYAAQNQLLRSYFSEEGLEYNLIRFPIGCSDFSTRPYSYADRCMDDFELKCFELAPEDTKPRIPLLHRIMAHAERPLSLVSSPWTSPGWLRVNNKVQGISRIKGKPGDRYHKTLANYFIRSLQWFSAFECEGPPGKLGERHLLQQKYPDGKNLNHFVTGWIDWNLALDMEGGPNWVDNLVDSPIIVNPLKDEFYKQPMFYHLGHFSKFIPEGSVRVGFTSRCLFDSCHLKTSAFLRPDGIGVVVVLNE